MTPLSDPLETRPPKCVSEDVFSQVVTHLNASRVSLGPSKLEPDGITGGAETAVPGAAGDLVPAREPSDPDWLKDSVSQARVTLQEASAMWLRVLGVRARLLPGSEVCRMNLEDDTGMAASPEAPSAPGATQASRGVRVLLAPVTPGVNTTQGRQQTWKDALHVALLRLASLGSLPVAVVIHGTVSLVASDRTTPIGAALADACAAYDLELLALGADASEMAAVSEGGHLAVLGLDPEIESVQPGGMPAAGDAILLLGGDSDGGVATVDRMVYEAGLITAVRMLVHGGRVHKVFPVTDQGLAVALGAAFYDAATSQWSGAEIRSPDAQATPQPSASTDGTSVSSAAPGVLGEPPTQTPLFPIEDYFNPRFAGNAVAVVGGLDAAKVAVQARLLGVGAVLLGRVGGERLLVESGPTSRVWDAAGNPVAVASVRSDVSPNP